MSFIDLLTSKVSYNHAIGNKYHVSSLDAQMESIVNEMISSNLLSSDSLCTYALYICEKRLLLKQSLVLHHFKELSKERAEIINLGVPHVVDAKIYSSNNVGGY